MKTVLMAAVAVAALAVGGCASNKAAKTEASMGIVNSKCPMMPDHPATTKTVVDYKGQKVGLCCAGCIKGWNGLSDADKAAKLQAAK